METPNLTASSSTTPTQNDIASPAPAADEWVPGYVPKGSVLSTVGVIEKGVNENDPETKARRVARLNHLLEQSSIYTKILSEKMERQKAERVKAQNRKDTKDAKKGTASAEGAEGAKGKATTAATGSKRKAEDYDMDEVLGTEDLKKPRMAPAATKDGLLEGAQPKLITGATLRDYQLAGVNWLISLYENGLNGILADEMGLGKTLQTISFIAHLREKGVWGPFLIVGPLSVLNNWVVEFNRFAPDIPVIQYHGSADDRLSLRRTVMSAPKDATGSKYAGGPRNMPAKTSNLKNLSKTQKRQIKEKKEEDEAHPGTTMNNFPVIITTFEVAMIDQKALAGYKWKYIVVDEGHRLKNMDCRLIRELKTFTSANRLILTGTPLHNNLTELWSLLNFILPDIFDDLASFQDWFNLDEDLSTSEENAAKTEVAGLLSKDQSTGIVSKLHGILKPFLLRRLKVDVEKDLPPKKEYLLHAPLTIQQKSLYEVIVDRSIREYLVQAKLDNLGGGPSAAESGASGTSTPLGTSVDSPADVYEGEETISLRRKKRASTTNARKNNLALDESDDAYFDRLQAEMENPEESNLVDAQAISKAFNEKKARTAVGNMKLQNIMMQLRKVASHPYLFDWPTDPNTNQPIVHEDLINASGKMLLLNRLLDELFKRKHKVLLFSQFTTMLDIIEDWATEYKGLKICRIDGNTTQESRRTQMLEFNSAGEEDGVCRLFLLSTRAGGLGINLVAADTVIFYDQDWNPQMDLQAQDRAHRIGQKRPVLIFRLISAHTVETHILKRAGAKRKLEALVIADGKFKGLGSEGSQKKSTLDEAADMLRLEGENINLVQAGDKIISDEDLDTLLDRSPAAYARGSDWHSSKKNSGEASTAFQVFVQEKDEVNDGLASAS